MRNRQLVIDRDSTNSGLEYLEVVIKANFYPLSKYIPIIIFYFEKENDLIILDVYLTKLYLVVYGDNTKQ